MKEQRLLVTINTSSTEVFEYATNSKNTPKWIDGIVEEVTNESPVRLGTIYRNQNKSGEWSEYEMTSFESNRAFVMSKKGTNYHVRYTLRPIRDNQTELEYFEWVDSGELEEPFTEETPQKLKATIEQG